MARTDPKLRKDLLEKLGISKQALSQRTKKKRERLAMHTDDATYLVAHDAGLRLEKYLDAEKVAHVRQLQAQLGATGESPAPPPSRSRPRPGASVRELKINGDVVVKDPLLSDAMIQDANRMAKVYPQIYVLENSIRHVIQAVMTHHHGEDWWDKRMNSGKRKTIHNNVANRMKTESRQAWHQKRGAHPIDYTDFEDLGKIVSGHRDLFEPDVISDYEFFESLMKQLYPSRNVLCHMNPLDSDNVKDVGIKLRRWQKMIRQNKSNIPL